MSSTRALLPGRVWIGLSSFADALSFKFARELNQFGDPPNFLFERQLSEIAAKLRLHCFASFKLYRWMMSSSIGLVVRSLSHELFDAGQIFMSADARGDGDDYSGPKTFAGTPSYSIGFALRTA